MLVGPGVGGTFLAFYNLSFGRMVRPGRKDMKLLLVTAVTITTALAVSPASAQKASAQKAAAQKTGCTSENMAKLVASGNTMPDSPGKFAMLKEMGAANAAMSKGDMRSACKSYMRAQQISGQKS
jgi:cytochrome c-type biogenesis protein CcmH/NrfG